MEFKDTQIVLNGLIGKEVVAGDFITGNRAKKGKLCHAIDNGGYFFVGDMRFGISDVLAICRASLPEIHLKG